MTVNEKPFIRFDEVTKDFRRPDGKGTFTAVDRLTFNIEQGEIVAVLGKTGCGKSTMFNLLAGLIEPTRGKVDVNGHDPFREFDYFRGRIGIVFQNDRLMPWRSALDNVLLGLQILDKDKEESEQIARGWLTRLGLSGHENDYPHALSGGMRQRVSIARAFAVEPEILLCDEPFSSLDEMTARDLRQEFLRLVRQNGRRRCSSPITSTKPSTSATGCWCSIARRGSPTRRHRRRGAPVGPQGDPGRDPQGALARGARRDAVTGI